MYVLESRFLSKGNKVIQLSFEFSLFVHFLIVVYCRLCIAVMHFLFPLKRKLRIQYPVERLMGIVKEEMDFAIHKKCKV